MRYIHHSQPYLNKIALKPILDDFSKGEYFNSLATETFEDHLQQLTGGGALALQPSGTLALYQSLKNIKIKGKTDVIVSSYVCDSVLWAIKQNNLNPVFCDLNKDSWTISAQQVEKVINENVLALLLTPVFGFSMDIKSFRRFKVPIILDLCQSFDYFFDYHNNQDLGDFFILSFHPTKMFPAGFGGAIGAATEPFSTVVNEIKNYPFEFPNINARIGIWLLGEYEKIRAMRKKNSSKYLSLFCERYTERLKKHQSTWQNFRFLIWNSSTDFELLQKRCHTRGIAIRRGVDDLLHRRIPMKDRIFPNTCEAFAKTVSIPMHASLTESEIIKVAEETQKCMNQI